VRVRRNDPSSNGVSATCQRDPGGVGRRCMEGGELQSVSAYRVMNGYLVLRPSRYGYTRPVGLNGRTKATAGIGWKIDLRAKETYEVQR